MKMDGYTDVRHFAALFGQKESTLQNDPVDMDSDKSSHCVKVKCARFYLYIKNSFLPNKKKTDGILITDNPLFSLVSQ